MSLLRLCAFSKSLTGRISLERFAGHLLQCNACLRARNDIQRRIAEKPWTVFQRNYCPLIPKKDDDKTRVWKQYQLLDGKYEMLEARIQQLQSDAVMDVNQSEVQLLKVPSGGKRASAGTGQKRVPKEGADACKEGQAKRKTGAANMPVVKTYPSRWIEKLKREKKKNKTTQQQQQEAPVKQVKTITNVEKQKLPGTTFKTISKLKKCPAATKSEPPGSAVSQAKATPQKLAKCAPSEEAVRENKADEFISERPIEEGQNNRYGDAQLNVCCYLEACVVSGDVDRAQRCLFHYHRHIPRRKLLSISAYNTMMRVWAKKGSMSQIGRLFIMVEEAGLKPNLTTYSAALECMGRNASCSPRVIGRCLQQLKQDGLSLDDLFRQCAFRQDEREMVLKAVQVVEPDFRPSTDTTQHMCSSPLVQDFYSKREEARFPKLSFSLSELQERFERQLRMEQAASVTIDSVEAAKPITESQARMRELLEVLRSHWCKALLQALKEAKVILGHSSQKSGKMNLYPYLCLLDNDEYVDIMLQGLCELAPNGETLVMFASSLGHKVYNKYIIQQKNNSQMVDKLRNIYNDYAELLSKDTETCDVLPRERWAELAAELANTGSTLASDDTQWPQSLMVHLGTHLVDLMVQELKVHSDVLNSGQTQKLIPVLYHMYTFRSNRQVGFIKPHPVLIQILSESMETKLNFESYVMPMLCPPLPWTSPKFGTYLLSPTKLMRADDGAIQHQLLLEKCRNPDLHAVLDSLNQLGNCAWKINKPLLDVIVGIFNDKGNEKMKIPPPMSEAPEVPRFNSQDPSYSSAEQAHLKREMIKSKKKVAEMHSLRMSALYTLSIANHVRDEIFWFPHNMDFRGRTYPCPPYFNHLGSDVTRAILVFAEGRPLGGHGLDWLKIHLVNLTGLKKRGSLAVRLEYANSIMDDILDSADRPLTGRKWWMNVDEPWQALACCMEITNAARSPDHTRFVSHFPVHQDGSCNGLQHYAALGRDVIGATSVNLVPCEEPQDVYSVVAQQVEEFRARDAEKGEKIALVLQGFINRKVVKQTVMTVVYGVTRYGGRLQIEKRLRETDGFPMEYVWDASHYLVNQVFNSLKEMFTGTREIQDWLTESARLIAKSGHTVEWVTPLGLPIIQPYHRSRKLLLKSNMQSVQIQVNHDFNERPDIMKQKNAFPPNFIHSLDSTHMMLTALYCYRAGLTFVSVHDCFWTHAVNVDTMNKVCREQFVALHSQPILQQLSLFLVRRYGSGPPVENKRFLEHRKMMELLSQVPNTGDFDLQKVKESTYFFS
nr:DNA-directed RNA polymerase, mitochondrial isoform X1 [Paramormyrops kingsleyae]